MTTPTFVNVFRGSTNQSIPNAAWTTVLFNIIETDGTSNVIYDSPTGQFAAPVTGWFDIESQITWASSITSSLRIIKNGNNTLPEFIQSNTAEQADIKLRLFLGQNEFIQVQALQASEGAINILASIDPSTLGQPGRCSSGTFTLVKPSPSVTFTTF